LGCRCVEVKCFACLYSPRVLWVGVPGGFESKKNKKVHTCHGFLCASHCCKCNVNRLTKFMMGGLPCQGSSGPNRWALPGQGGVPMGPARRMRGVEAPTLGQ
jgi:hypothetical protein